MSWLIAMLGLSVAATIAAGVWLELKPRRLPAPAWLKGGVLANMLVFGIVMATTLLLYRDGHFHAVLDAAVTPVAMKGALEAALAAPPQEEP